MGSTLLGSEFSLFSFEYCAHGTVFCYTARFPVQRLGEVSVCKTHAFSHDQLE